MASGSFKLGTDLVRIADVRRSLRDFGKNYLRRIFTPGERKDCQGRSDAAPGLAARFAAKEAVLKLLDVGDEAVPWVSIEVVRGPSGAPRLRLHGSARRLARRRRVSGFVVSLAHEAEYASAVVLAARDAAPRARRRRTRRT